MYLLTQGREAHVTLGKFFFMEKIEFCINKETKCIQKKGSTAEKGEKPKFPKETHCTIKDSLRLDLSFPKIESIVSIPNSPRSYCPMFKVLGIQLFYQMFK